MWTNFPFQSRGPNSRSTANPDELSQTLECENYDGNIVDDSSPSCSGKTGSRSPSTSLSQYDTTVASSSSSPTNYTTSAVVEANNSVSSTLPLRPLTAPQQGKGYRSEDERDSKRPRAIGAQSDARNESNKNPTRHHLQPEVWEHYKEEIHELYIEQNMSLNELMEIMQDKGFKATPRMYKAKFGQWGFVKNNKRKDVATMLRLQRDRGAVGKPTTFHRHGRSVDIETYMRRKGVSTLELVTADADLPDYLRALTPPPADPQHMTLPSHLHAQEVLVSCFRDLTLSWRDSVTSPTSFEDDFNVYFDGELCEATRDFSRACWFFSRGHTSHGALLSHRAFSSLHLLIKTPSALGLFDLLIASAISPDHGLAKELWRYLAGYSEATLGSSSTFYRLFAALDEVIRNYTLDTGVEFIFSCIESILGMLLETNDFSRTIAPSISLFLLGDLILFSSTKTNLPNLQRTVATTSSVLRSHGSHHAPGAMKLIEPAAYLWQNGPQDEQSAQLAYAFVQLQDETSHRFDWVYWVSWRVIAYFHRSRCGADASTVKDNPRHALARYALGKAIDAAEAGRGYGESQIFENMQTLENWHREAGDTLQELALRRRRESGLRHYFETLWRGHTVRAPNSRRILHT
ncbi:hypothetical protein GGR54DRAFT_227730 [Hypoxylon sp. NC1633]|nr:hypothetical protein GGR54DRAFT_227730 [Hypoxylon sp. NC1633]